MGKHPVKLFSSRVEDETRVFETPGRVLKGSKDGLDVETGQGIVRIRELQAPGKKRLPAEEFLRGFPIHRHTILV